MSPRFSVTATSLALRFFFSRMYLLRTASSVRPGSSAAMRDHFVPTCAERAAGRGQGQPTRGGGGRSHLLYGLEDQVVLRARPACRERVAEVLAAVPS